MALDAGAEFERLNALRRYAILDTPADGAFDRITRLAAEMLEAPVAVVSLVDTNRVWMKSVFGPFPAREIGHARVEVRRPSRRRRWLIEAPRRCLPSSPGSYTCMLRPGRLVAQEVETGAVDRPKMTAAG